MLLNRLPVRIQESLPIQLKGIISYTPHTQSYLVPLPWTSKQALKYSAILSMSDNCHWFLKSVDSLTMPNPETETAAEGDDRQKWKEPERQVSEVRKWSVEWLVESANGGWLTDGQTTAPPDILALKHVSKILRHCNNPTLHFCLVCECVVSPSVQCSNTGLEMRNRKCWPGCYNVRESYRRALEQRYLRSTFRQPSNQPLPAIYSPQTWQSRVLNSAEPH